MDLSKYRVGSKYSRCFDRRSSGSSPIGFHKHLQPGSWCSGSPAPRVRNLPCSAHTRSQLQWLLAKTPAVAATPGSVPLVVSVKKSRCWFEVPEYPLLEALAHYSLFG